MPAETHQHRDPIRPGAVLELLWTVLALPDQDPDPGVLLDDLGVDSDMMLLDLWDAAAEEYGERTLGDVDLEDLQQLTTLGELAHAIIESVRVDLDEV
jgi:hypothetical protein